MRFRTIEHGLVRLFFRSTPQSGGRLSQRTLARFVRLENRVTHALHCLFCDFASFLRTVIENIPYLLGIRLKFFALGLYRLNPADQIVSHKFLTIDAPDSSGAAFCVDTRNSLGRRKQLVPREDGANLRAAGVGPANALRVGHHVARFGTNLVGRIAEPDGVAVGLRHAPAIEAWKPRCFGRQIAGLAEDNDLFEEVLTGANSFEEVICSDLRCYSTKFSLDMGLSRRVDFFLGRGDNRKFDGKEFLPDACQFPALGLLK